MPFIPVTRGSSGESSENLIVHMYRGTAKGSRNQGHSVSLRISRAVSDAMGWVPGFDRVIVMIGTGEDLGRLQITRSAKQWQGSCLTPDGHLRSMTKSIVNFTIPQVLGGEPGRQLADMLATKGLCEVVIGKPALTLILPRAETAAASLPLRRIK